MTPAPTEIYTLSLHDALPISGLRGRHFASILCVVNFNYNDFFEPRRDLCGGELVVKGTRVTVRTLLASLAEGASVRSEEHTSELQSLTNLVCRLLLEKKNNVI